VPSGPGRRSARACSECRSRSANEEAIAYRRRAFVLLATLPDDRERDHLELGLQMAIATPLGASGSFSRPDCEAAHARARALATRTREWPELARVLLHVAIHHLERREPERALALADELVELAAALGFPSSKERAGFFAGGGTRRRGRPRDGHRRDGARPRRAGEGRRRDRGARFPGGVRGAAPAGRPPRRRPRHRGSRSDAGRESGRTLDRRRDPPRPRGHAPRPRRRFGGSGGAPRAVSRDRTATGEQSLRAARGHGPGEAPAATRAVRRGDVFRPGCSRHILCRIRSA